MENSEARAIIRILVDAQGPEKIAARFIEILDEQGFTDVEIQGTLELGQANATKEG